MRVEDDIAERVEGAKDQQAKKKEHRMEKKYQQQQEQSFEIGK